MQHDHRKNVSQGHSFFDLLMLGASYRQARAESIGPARLSFPFHDNEL